MPQIPLRKLYNVTLTKDHKGSNSLNNIIESGIGNHNNYLIFRPVDPFIFEIKMEFFCRILVLILVAVIYSAECMHTVPILDPKMYVGRWYQVRPYTFLC